MPGSLKDKIKSPVVKLDQLSQDFGTWSEKNPKKMLGGSVGLALGVATAKIVKKEKKEKTEGKRNQNNEITTKKPKGKKYGETDLLSGSSYYPPKP